MIGKSELLRMARTFQLNPHVVEKDYALGWVLAGISAHQDLADDWVFKGGTCLKKCFFETYRFSEDLDFTLKNEAHLNELFLHRVFADIADWIYEQSGLEFPSSSQEFDIFLNARGRPICQGKLSYRGPISPRSGGLPRIKLDLIVDEIIVREPVRRFVFHPYSDEPVNRIDVLSYAYEEVFAEKVRALADRVRPRDLYDVVNLYRNFDARPRPTVLRGVLHQKCRFKGLAVPQDGDLDRHRDTLEGSWKSMLGHQLPTLPPLDSFWAQLPDFFGWIESMEEPPHPEPLERAGGETIIQTLTTHLPVRRNIQLHLECIRFAAANWLCVELAYGHKDGPKQSDMIEPYALRCTQDRDIVLLAWNVNLDQLCRYRVDRVLNAQTTQQSFTPRFAIELIPDRRLSVS